MKTTTFICVILYTAFTACKKDSTEISPNLGEQVEMQNTLQIQLQPNVKVSLRLSEKSTQPECQLPDCNFVINEQHGILLAEANEKCLPMSSCLECCMNNWVTYVIMYVEPTSAKCNLVDYKSTILESF
jgi:hypothetical protein